MDVLHIETSNKTYPVYVGQNAIALLPDFLKENNAFGSSILIITDESVGHLYLQTLKDTLSDIEKEVYVSIVPSGEKAKTFDVYYSCLTRALEFNLNRKSLILALGGGAVGDLAGFVAATYMRGIPFIQIPTTILAHDSAVGGKVAINHEAGKNMIGAFHQPEAVFYDLNFLATLPLHEVRSGFAEIIKEALIEDPDFYSWLTTNIHSMDLIDMDQLAFAIKKGIAVKGGIVKQDEMENGVRAYLNFGHTLGHAIENSVGYGSITHGEGVMIGMVFALKLSIKYAGLNFDLTSFINWVTSLGYKTKIPSSLKAEQLIYAMKKDKKTTGREITFVLLAEEGKPITKTMADDEIITEIELMFENKS
ncbi:3-dehydroquinate synthase [Peribacillus deserti]|uniref:3-dehydroquinate synthase n=1 Tax=Peribacillus deserti TaxID=673318 RepID=A0ABS2QHM5_9BACI|nr:3-dehydroquinate synthase [Peribacillus deserti]MBM7692642.1 3-dehydroquinate synthase [Peribacillus deserti]